MSIKMSDSFKELGGTVDEGKTKLANVDGKVNEIAAQSKNAYSGEPDYFADCL